LTKNLAEFFADLQTDWQDIAQIFVAMPRHAKKAVPHKGCKAITHGAAGLRVPTAPHNPTELSKIRNSRSTARLPSPHLLLNLITPALNVLIGTLQCLHLRTQCLGLFMERHCLPTTLIGIRPRYFLIGSEGNFSLGTPLLFGG